jgi:hypothetical protein
VTIELDGLGTTKVNLAPSFWRGCTDLAGVRAAFERALAIFEISCQRGIRSWQVTRRELRVGHVFAGHPGADYDLGAIARQRTICESRPDRFWWELAGAMARVHG